MNHAQLDELKQYCNSLDAKTIKLLSLDVLLRIIDKVQDIEDAEIEAILKEMHHVLTSSIEQQGATSTYRRLFKVLQKKLIKDYKWHQQGSLKGQYISLGISIGVAMGVALGSISTGFLGVGIGVGLALGAGIGAQKEQQAVNENRVY